MAYVQASWDLKNALSYQQALALWDRITQIEQSQDAYAIGTNRDLVWEGIPANKVDTFVADLTGKFRALGATDVEVVRIPYSVFKDALGI